MIPDPTWIHICAATSFTSHVCPRVNAWTRWDSSRAATWEIGKIRCVARHKPAQAPNLKLRLSKSISRARGNIRFSLPPSCLFSPSLFFPCFFLSSSYSFFSRVYFSLIFFPAKKNAKQTSTRTSLLSSRTRNFDCSLVKLFYLKEMNTVQR